MGTLTRCQDGIDAILGEITYVLNKCTGGNIKALTSYTSFKQWLGFRLQWIGDLTQFNWEQDLKYRSQIHHLLACLESYFSLLNDPYISMALQNITELLSYAKIIKGIVDIQSIESFGNYIIQIQQITNPTDKTVAFEALLVATQQFEGSQIAAMRKTINALLAHANQESQATNKTPWRAIHSLVNIIESTARR